MINIYLNNIQHINVNSGETVEYPDGSVLPDGVRTDMERMVEQAVTSGIVSVMDNKYGSIEARCFVDLEKGRYTATLYYKEMPEELLLETAGSINAEYGEMTCEYFKKFHEASWDEAAPAVKYPTGPFICDCVFSSIILAPRLWDGDFTKCFGIYMLNMLSQYEAMQKMEESSETVRDSMILGCETKPVRDGLRENQEHVIFDTDRDGIVMKIFLNNLTQTEVKEFATGVIIYTGMAHLEDISFFAVRVGKLNWIAVPCRPGLTRCLTRLDNPETGNRIPLKIVLSDAESGEKRWVTSVGLRGPLCRQALKEGEKLGRKEYDRELERVLSSYSVQHIVKQLEPMESQK